MKTTLCMLEGDPKEPGQCSKNALVKRDCTGMIGVLTEGHLREITRSSLKDSRGSKTVGRKILEDIARHSQGIASRKRRITKMRETSRGSTASRKKKKRSARTSGKKAGRILLGRRNLLKK